MPRHQYGNQTEDLSPQERDLRQLLQLAQLHSIVSEPDLEQQKLDQSDQATKLTAAIHLMGLQQDAEQRQAALEEQQKLREASVKGNVMDSLISHLSQRTDVPLSTLADTLEKGGHGELATTLRAAHAQGVKDKTAIHLNNIKALGSDPKKVDTYLTGIGNDPEVAAAVKASLPAVAATPIDTTSTGTKLGSTTRYAGLGALMANPVNLAAANAYFGYQTGKKLINKPGFVQDFWNALINKPQPATQ